MPFITFIKPLNKNLTIDLHIFTKKVLTPLNKPSHPPAKTLWKNPKISKIKFNTVLITEPTA